MKDIRKYIAKKYPPRKRCLNIVKNKIQTESEAKLQEKILRETVIGDDGKALWRGLPPDEAFDKGVAASRRKLKIINGEDDDAFVEDIKEFEEAHNTSKNLAQLYIIYLTYRIIFCWF